MSALFKRISLQDAFVPLTAIVAILMLVIPIPAWLLDMFLILNMGLSVTVLVTTMFIRKILDLSVFPSLLLLTTLFRLALEVSATRLILLDANAGSVIQTFGQMVVGGNLVVGIIIFIILIVIQFLVITKGAERVSEVAARFTLDAMPGKQMSIDAEMNAGLIGEAEARRRRHALEQEADFYGAMDGASKFVRGDAVASMVIVVVNIIGGLLVGLLQHHLSIGSALTTYTILTVGEALTTQIPSLLLSTSAGMMVTRSGEQTETLGTQVFSQLTAIPRVLYITAVVMGALALFGMPPIPLLIMAVAAYYAGRRVDASQKESAKHQLATEKQKQTEDQRKPETALKYIGLDPVELEVGMGLVPLIGTGQANDLKDRIHALRKQIASQLGLIIPPVRVRDNLELDMNAYRIRIRGAEIASGEVLPNHYMAFGVEKLVVDNPIATQDPVYHFPAWWVPLSSKDRAEAQGATVIDAPSVIVTHLSDVLHQHGWEILGRQDVQMLVDHVRQTHPAVVQELIPDLLSLGDVQKVLSNLLHERISIRDLPTILEALADRAKATKDPDLLTESVRQALGRSICRSLVQPDGTLRVIALSPGIETEIRESIKTSDAGTYLAVNPMVAQRILSALQTQLNQLPPGIPAVVTASPVIRLYFKRLTERLAPGLTVISYAEISPDIPAMTIGVIQFPDTAPDVASDASPSFA